MVSASLGLEDLRDVRTFLPPYLRQDLLDRGIPDLPTLLEHSRADLRGMPRKMSETSIDTIEKKLSVRGYALNTSKKPYRWPRDMHQADWEAIFSIPWRRNYERKLLSILHENGNHAILLDETSRTLEYSKYPFCACWNDAFRNSGLPYRLYIVLLHRQDAVQLTKRILGN